MSTPTRARALPDKMPSTRAVSNRTFITSVPSGQSPAPTFRMLSLLPTPTSFRFGPNKRLLNHRGAVGKVVGGWSVSGIQQYQSGRPIHIEYDAFGSNNPFFAAGDGYAFRVNTVPGQPLKNPAYNKSCSGPRHRRLVAILASSGINPGRIYHAACSHIW